MKEITLKQAAILDFIIKYKEDNYGLSPCIREIATGKKITVRAAYDFLILLKKKGYIDWIPKSARSLKIIKTPEIPFFDIQR